MGIIILPFLLYHSDLGISLKYLQNDLKDFSPKVLYHFWTFISLDFQIYFKSEKNWYLLNVF